jgi:hypothetical protein
LNKTVVFVSFVAIAMIGFAGICIIAIVRPDATATVINTLITVLTVVSGFAITAYSLGKVNDKVEVVQKQTNGTLSTLIAANNEKDAEILRLRAQMPSHVVKGNN